MQTEAWREIHKLHGQGVPIREIARRMDMARNTVRRALGADGPPERKARPPVRSAVDAYEPRIIELLLRDPRVSTRVIAQRVGWTRSQTVLKDRVRKLRAELSIERPTNGRSGKGPGLPADLTSFVGRRAELAQIGRLLGSARLVSLTGPGGVGKTRLATRVAAAVQDRFGGGTWMVPLGALRDPALVAQSLLDGLGIADASRSTGDPLPPLIAHLEGRRALLVLDNCEHLLDGVAPLITTLLERAPGLTVLATSRQPLGITGEHAVAVPPLGILADAGTAALGDVLASPAVALFADRAAAAVLPDFAVTGENCRTVAALCGALDGIPLAIELATVRLRALSLDDLLARLDHRFAVLTEGSTGAPERHRTLESTIGWSFELCTEHERALWTRASVFAGGFDLAAATAVCADDTLPPGSVLDAVSGLVAKSILVRDDPGTQVRFHMLETLREFGDEHLPLDERAAVQARHRDWCLSLVTTCTAAWFGPDQTTWRRRMRSEQANLRAALEHALAPGGDPAAAQRLVGVPWFLWATALSFTEHRRWLQQALAASDAPTPERARALGTCALVASLQGDQEAAGALAGESLELARHLVLPGAIAYATHVLGLAAFFSGDAPRAQSLFDEAGTAYGSLGVGDDLRGALAVHLGLLSLSRGRLDKAKGYLEDVHGRCQERGETWVRAYARGGLGYIALARGDVDGAAAAAGEALQLIAEFDDTIGLAFGVDLTAWTAAAAGQSDRAAVLLGAASALWGSFGEQLYGAVFFQEWRAQYQTSARDALDAAGFDAAHRRGGQLGRRELLRLALADDGGGASGSSLALSMRELEVARLVAAGHTNREIAGQLVVSPRTVEGHVSRALGKLGFSRRSQLASWITSEESAPRRLAAVPSAQA